MRANTAAVRPAAKPTARPMRVDEHRPRPPPTAAASTRRRAGASPPQRLARMPSSVTWRSTGGSVRQFERCRPKRKRRRCRPVQKDRPYGQTWLKSGEIRCKQGRSYWTGHDGKPSASEFVGAVLWHRPRGKRVRPRRGRAARCGSADCGAAVTVNGNRAPSMTPAGMVTCSGGAAARCRCRWQWPQIARPRFAAAAAVPAGAAHRHLERQGRAVARSAARQLDGGRQPASAARRPGTRGGCDRPRARPTESR